MNRIPYVIDNLAVKLADVLNDLLAGQPQLDIATAYFSVRGFELVRTTLPGVRHCRLLLGDDPQDAAAVGARPNSHAYLHNELNAEPLTAATQRLVEALIRFLRRDAVEVRLYLGHPPATEGRRAFLHAKCYQLYGGRRTSAAISSSCRSTINANGIAIPSPAQCDARPPVMLPAKILERTLQRGNPSVLR